MNQAREIGHRRESFILLNSWKRVVTTKNVLIGAQDLSWHSVSFGWDSGLISVAYGAGRSWWVNRECAWVDLTSYQESCTWELAGGRPIDRQRATDVAWTL
jgi:hypothetical protein